MAAGLRRIATTVGFVLLCLALTSCAREGRRFYSSEPSVVPSVNAASYEDLSRLAGFTVATPSYLPTGLNSEPEYSYIPDLREAELAYYAAASVSPPPIVVRLSETLDPDHGHCPPCPQSLSAYDQKTVLGQQVLLARFPSEESRTRILAYFWLNDVFVTLVIERTDAAAKLPSPDELEAEILRIAASMIGKPI